MTTQTPETPKRDDMFPTTEYLEKYFWPRVVKTDGCWNWTGAISKGYGNFTYAREGKRKAYSTHRLAYRVLMGDPPDGMVLDHLCRNRPCCNPAHMELVTNTENLKRGYLARGYGNPRKRKPHVPKPPKPRSEWKVRTKKPYCRHGHEYTAETTTYGSDGARKCRICSHNNYLRKKAA